MTRAIEKVVISKPGRVETSGLAFLPNPLLDVIGPFAVCVSEGAVGVNSETSDVPRSRPWRLLRVADGIVDPYRRLAIQHMRVQRRISRSLNVASVGVERRNLSVAIGTLNAVRLREVRHRVRRLTRRKRLSRRKQDGNARRKPLMPSFP